jgi:hypothetical protein
MLLDDAHRQDVALGLLVVPVPAISEPMTLPFWSNTGPPELPPYDGACPWMYGTPVTVVRRALKAPWVSAGNSFEVRLNAGFKVMTPGNPLMYSSSPTWTSASAPSGTVGRFLAPFSLSRAKSSPG